MCSEYASDFSKVIYWPVTPGPLLIFDLMKLDPIPAPATAIYRSWLVPHAQRGDLLEGEVRTFALYYTLKRIERHSILFGLMENVPATNLIILS